MTAWLAAHPWVTLLLAFALGVAAASIRRCPGTPPPPSGGLRRWLGRWLA